MQSRKLFLTLAAFVGVALAAAFYLTQSREGRPGAAAHPAVSPESRRVLTPPVPAPPPTATPSAAARERARAFNAASDRFNGPDDPPPLPSPSPSLLP